MLRALCYYRTNKKHAKAQEDSVPAFEEDQEVEYQAMVLSPIKGGKCITSEVHSLLVALLAVLLNSAMKVSG